MQLLDKVLIKLGHSLGLPSEYKLLKKIGAVSGVAVSSSCPLSTRCHRDVIAAAETHIIAIYHYIINVPAHARASSIITRQTLLLICC
jgi:hypothetical protein